MSTVKRTYVLFILLMIGIAHTSVVIAKDRVFSPKAIAAMEVQLWQDYYNKDYYRLAYHLWHFCHDTLALSSYDAIKAGNSFMKAAKKFHQMPRGSSRKDYQKKVLPDLIHAYQIVKKTHKHAWDPKQAAMLELRWWVSRRVVRRHRLKVVARDLANLYEYVFQKKNKQLRAAAYYRAYAAHLRDKQKRRGRVKWQSIDKYLIKSYTYLLKGLS